ncbi:MAG: pyruvate ferredoxin oxidoreductase [bacterium]
MKTILEGSRAVATTIKNIAPAVISAYPITPQTHIVENLAKFKADGLADFEYVITESEFAAISIVQGAVATGVRAYTATSSQGLLMMSEAIFNIAGMRLPVVMTCANRAISAPINIYNDQQDALTFRDAGWLMFFAEDVQEACDLHVLAYKVAEKLSLPVMVNMDGFILTHVVEPVDIPETKNIKKFLPPYQPEIYLDPKNPLTLGAYVGPQDYLEMRQALHQDIIDSEKTILEEMKNFQNIFGRKLSMVEYFGPKNPETIIVAMGSVIGTIREALDEFKNKTVGVLKITALRPLADKQIIKLLNSAKNIAILDKSISLGTEGILATEIRRTIKDKKIISFVAGLGGRDIKIETIKNIIKLTEEAKEEKTIFLRE